MLAHPSRLADRSRRRCATANASGVRTVPYSEQKRVIAFTAASVRSSNTM
jgi:hypothetical protein